MKLKFRIVSYLVYALLIFPLLFLPTGFDYSIFFVGGKIIANGGKLFIDFIDIKPPLVYYIFALLHFLFNNNLFLYQFANTFIFVVTSCLTFEVAYLIFKNKWIAFLAPIPMILFAASFNYNYIFEPELALNLILMINALILFKAKKSFTMALFISILSGFAFGLKYPFGIILIPILVYQYINTAKSSRIKVFLATFFGFIFSASLPFIILIIQNGTLKDFYNVLNFINYYQSTGFFSPKAVVRVTNNIQSIISVFYSLFFTIAFFYGVWKIFGQWRTLDSFESQLHSYLLLNFFCLAFSIIVEHQFLNYHFLRIASVLSIYSGFGLYLMFKEFIHIPKNVRLFLYPVIIFVFIFYTPILRYIRTALPTYYFFTNKNKYIDYFENTSTANTLLRQHTTIANLINQNLTPNDTVVIIGGAAQIYTMLNDCHISAFPTSVFVLSRFKKPKEWEQRFLKELQTAKYLVIQDYDHTHFFGEEVSSWEAFNRNLLYRNILENRYKPILKTFSFYVFKAGD
ncbi:MAG: glycosyltransferase family 39 protein [Bacteroidota bacterium]